LEVIALLSGLKKVMRLVVDNKSHDLIVNKLSAFNLYAVRSHWNMKTSFRTSLGDVYTELTDQNDPESSSFVIMVSPKDKTAKEARALEDSSGKKGEIEKLFGYPLCCFRSYRNICKNRDWLEELLNNTKIKEFYPWCANRIAYLFNENSMFFDYFPCSLECDNTAAISRKMQELAPVYGLVSVCKKWIQEMCRPVLIRKGVVVQLREFNFNDQNGHLNFNPQKIALYGWKVAADADKDFTWGSDSIKRIGKELHFFKNGKSTGYFIEEINDNRLLVFKEIL